MSPSPSNLLTRAVKIATVQNPVSYSWISTHQLLVQTSTNGYPNTRGSWSGYVEIFDTQRGHSTRLDKLTAVLMQHRIHYSSPGPTQFSQSPNGEWLMWERLEASDGGRYSVTARTDGSGYHEWKYPDEVLNSWLDNRLWLSYPVIGKATFFRVHDVLQKETDRLVVPDSAECQSLLERSGRDARSSAQGRILSVQRTESYVTAPEYRIYAGQTSGSRPINEAQIYTVKFIAVSRIDGLSVNNQMTRIAFLVNEKFLPPFAAALHRLVSSYTYPVHPVERLCIYNAETKRFYEVGRIDAPAAFVPPILNCSWLPDGKHMQFMYKNAVYMVSTDQPQ